MGKVIGWLFDVRIGYRFFRLVRRWRRTGLGGTMHVEIARPERYPCVCDVCVLGDIGDCDNERPPPDGTS